MSIHDGDGGYPVVRTSVEPFPRFEWRLRQSYLARRALGVVAGTCLVLLAVVAVVTMALVSVFGHPVAWSVVGCLFAALPLAGLVLAVAVRVRAAVVAGPRWVAFRVVGPWRVVGPDRPT